MSPSVALAKEGGDGNRNRPKNLRPLRLAHSTRLNMKRFVLLTNVISPHQLPLAREIAARVGDDHFRYVYTEVADKDHGGLGWALDVPKWCVHVGAADVDEWLENADVLLSGLRCFDMFERRAKKGLKNYYMTERWLKPPIGIARLAHPRYFGYARRLCRMMASGAVVGLPIGVHAARDMARLCGVMHGDLRCLFRAPEVGFERRPGGGLAVSGQQLAVSSKQLAVSAKRYCLGKMRMWGYFVEKQLAVSGKSGENSVKLTTPPLLHSSTLKVLWVGRLLKLKCVDNIIRAIGELAVSSQRLAVSGSSISLDIYGAGPEEERLKKMAKGYEDVIRFHRPVSIGEVRKLMREHDVYVLASNGYEGWGAVVSEALEEGMKVIGTYEAGSSATMLPRERLFHAGDWRALADLLAKEAKGELAECEIGE